MLGKETDRMQDRLLSAQNAGSRKVFGGQMLGDNEMNDETVKGLLRKAGLKVTNQRMMVLDIIASHPAEHLTAEEIYDLAKVNSPEIGLATIYRTVQVLLRPACNRQSHI